MGYGCGETFTIACSDINNSSIHDLISIFVSSYGWLYGSKEFEIYCIYKCDTKRYTTWYFFTYMYCSEYRMCWALNSIINQDTSQEELFCTGKYIFMIASSIILVRWETLYVILSPWFLEWKPSGEPIPWRLVCTYFGEMYARASRVTATLHVQGDVYISLPVNHPCQSPMFSIISNTPSLFHMRMSDFTHADNSIYK